MIDGKKSQKIVNKQQIAGNYKKVWRDSTFIDLNFRCNF